MQSIKEYKMLDETNFIADAQKTCSVKQTHSDYGSTLTKHGADHNRFHDLTSNQQHFSKQNIVTVDQIIGD